MKAWTTFEVTALRAAYTRMAEPEAHWFSPDTMRFFRSRLERTAYVGPGGVFFVTSEQFSDESPRLYSVRVWRGSKIDTTGEFQGYRSLEAAREAAKAAAAAPLVRPAAHIGSELIQLASGTIFAVPKEASCE